jgi:hypothetical protein
MFARVISDATHNTEDENKHVFYYLKVCWAHGEECTLSDIYSYALNANLSKN